MSRFRKPKTLDSVSFVIHNGFSSLREDYADRCIRRAVSFVVNTRENDFEPPHVHVWVGNEDVCRIELNGPQFMEDPPPGEHRNIMEAYRKHAVAIRREWDRIHRR